MKDSRDLRVWQGAHQVTLTVYRCTRDFPREETYGIVRQLRRCSASVAVNIAEGCGRSGNAEFGRFLTMATGSASELEYFLLLARDLEYLTPEKCGPVAQEVLAMRRMLNRLLSKVRADREIALQGRGRSAQAMNLRTNAFAKC
jgi:four helix bundle protein